MGDNKSEGVSKERLRKIAGNLIEEQVYYRSGKRNLKLQYRFLFAFRKWNFKS